MSRRANFALLALIALSTPLALVLEAGMRRYLMTAQMLEFREWLGPQITPWAWGLVGLAGMSVMGALGLQPWAYASVQRRLEREQKVPVEQRPERARFETLMIVASIPQVPALLATAAQMFGAEQLPTLLCVGIGTAGVLVQWAGTPARAVPETEG